MSFSRQAAIALALPKLLVVSWCLGEHPAELRIDMASGGCGLCVVSGRGVFRRLQTLY